MCSIRNSAFVIRNLRISVNNSIKNKIGFVEIPIKFPKFALNL